MAKAEYTFTKGASKFPGHKLLRWEKDGKADPLNFWHIPPGISWDEAVARVRSGELG